MLIKFLNFVRRIFFQTIRSPKKIILVISVLILLTAIVAVYDRQKDPLAFYNKHHALIQFVQKLSNILYFPYWFSASHLERYDLVIDQQDWDFLDSNLPSTYEGQTLTSQYRQEVRAKFVAGDKEYAVKVRYRGEMDNHWRDPQKSWLIDFGKEKFYGAKEIHLIIPIDRAYLIEEFNYYRARKVGLVVPETKFVNFFVNGERQGVYWQIDGWVKDMLVKQNISEKTNLYGGIDSIIEILKNKVSYFDDIRYWRKYAEANKSYSDLISLLEIVNNPLDSYFQENIGKILDLNNFYQWQINQFLVSSIHETDANLRLYFDSTIGKFKFIPWDIELGETPPPFTEIKYNRLVTRILENPIFLHERNKLLWVYVGNPQNLADDLEYYDELDNLTKNDFYKDNKKVESDPAYRQKIKEMRKTIIADFNHVKNNVENAAAQVTVKMSKPKEMTMELASTGFSAVNLNKIKIKADNCDQKIKIFHDVNKNEIYDSADKFLSFFSCQDNIYQAKLDFLVYAIKDSSDPNYLKLGRNAEKLILVAEQSFDQKILADKQIAFEISNAVTGGTIKDVPIKFIYDF